MILLVVVVFTLSYCISLNINSLESRLFLVRAWTSSPTSTSGGDDDDDDIIGLYLVVCAVIVYT